MLLVVFVDFKGQVYKVVVGPRGGVTDNILCPFHRVDTCVSGSFYIIFF